MYGIILLLTALTGIRSVMCRCAIKPILKYCRYYGYNRTVDRSLFVNFCVSILRILLVIQCVRHLFKHIGRFLSKHSFLNEDLSRIVSDIFIRLKSGILARCIIRISILIIWPIKSISICLITIKNLECVNVHLCFSTNINIEQSCFTTFFNFVRNF